jgi:peptidoglycan/xylan/chitin deacetylase (PgdA/CDA1 family)
MRSQAIWLYRHFTSRQRRRLLDSLRESACCPVAIVFYHRIANTHPNGWTMTCDDFARQLDWMQEHYDVISLAEAQRRICSGYCPHPSVTVTFDDGYGENANFAIPELARRGLPATYFVSTDFVSTGRPFPHDLEAGVPLAPNTLEELRWFSEMGIELGAHTRNHIDLGSIFDRDTLLSEIQGSVDDLRAWTGQSIEYFAFPFGLPANTTQLAVDLLASLGIKGFCTAYGALNWPGDNGFHLKRIHADPGMERLKNWLTLDRRKLYDQAHLPFTVSHPTRTAQPDLVHQESV